MPLVVTDQRGGLALFLANRKPRQGWGLVFGTNSPVCAWCFIWVSYFGWFSCRHVSPEFPSALHKQQGAAFLKESPWEGEKTEILCAQRGEEGPWGQEQEWSPEPHEVWGARISISERHGQEIAQRCLLNTFWAWGGLGGVGR